MPKIISRLWRFLQALDAIEFVVVAVIAAVLVVLGPIVVVRRFVGEGHYFIAGVLGTLWIVCVAACVRDIRRGTLGWISGGMAAAWVVGIFVVGWVLQ